MEKITNPEEKGTGLSKVLVSPMQRRLFFRYAGATAALTTLVLTSACDDDDDDTKVNNQGVDLGSGDTGILNYAYALEQLEAAFYTRVVADSASVFSASELQVMQDLKGHEMIHRDFLKAALGSAAIANLEVDFSGINFTNKANVLATAKTFEDLGVAAYNGAGKLLMDTGLLTIAGKIVSVEARHAAVIADMISAGSFSNTANAQGLDPAMSPTEVLTAAKPFIKTTINFSNLPK